MRKLTQRKEKWKALAIYATLDNIQKNCYTSITDGEKLKNSFIFSVADNSVAVLFVYGQGNRVAVALLLPLAQNLKTV